MRSLIPGQMYNLLSSFPYVKTIVPTLVKPFKKKGYMTSLSAMECTPMLHSVFKQDYKGSWNGVILRSQVTTQMCISLFCVLSA